MNKYTIYEQRKQSFLTLNTPTSDEYEAFCRALAKEIGI
jgi:chloramphenicol O-acetyltransferase